MSACCARKTRLCYHNIIFCRTVFETAYTEHDMFFRTPVLAIAAVAALLFSGLAACGSRQEPDKLTVAAAANLTDVFTEVQRTFQTKTGLDVVFSYGSTVELSQQIANGGPFDVFAAADTEHIDSLVASGKLTRDSRAVYALGQL